MSNELLSDFVELDKVYELNIGRTLQNPKEAKYSYNQFKYDFTPASIDRNQEAKVTIGARNDVVIQVPHIDGSAQKYTQFTGNKQPCSTKECILIYDTETNEFTLERLESNFILKRSRLEGASKAQIITPRSVTPTNESQNKKKLKTDGKSNPSPANMNSNKSNPKAKDATPPPKSPKSVSQINADQLFGEDLNLSDASDSDSSTM